jgi:hypothetical protein
MTFQKLDLTMTMDKVKEGKRKKEEQKNIMMMMITSVSHIPSTKPYRV